MKTTKRALFSSVIALILCFSMLVGTTFAWFTDSVESGINTIVAGNLDVELYNAIGIDENKKVDTKTMLFDGILWEPGVVAYENLTVANLGTLALKYQLSVNFTNATTNAKGETLAKVLKVGVVEGGIDSAVYAGEAGRVKLVNELQKNDAFKPMENFVESGELEKQNDVQAYGIVIWWEPSVDDNDFNNQGKQMRIDLGIKLLATQLTAEDDSFDNKYDEDAIYYDALVKKDAELLAAIQDPQVKVIAIDENVTYNWGGDSYANSKALLMAGKTFYGVDGNETITFAGYGSANPIVDVTLKDITVKDTTVGDNEAAWEHGHLEFESLTANNVVFADSIMLNGDCTLTNCSMNNQIESWYGLWIEGGNTVIRNCSFTGTRAIKVHEANGSEVGYVVIDNNEFVSLSEKPGVVIGNVNAATSITLTNNLFAGTQPGDQGNNKYESDTAVTNFVDENNTVIEKVATNSEQLKNALANKATVYMPEGEYTLPTLSGKEGITIIGAADGSTVVGGNTSTGFGSNFGKNTTIKNVTFSGSTNGVSSSYAQGGDTVFENCTFAGDSTYGFHIDQSNGATFTFNNCTFSGFNAFAGDLVKVIFNNCTFLHNGNYGHTNIWSVAEFNNCTFGDKTSVGQGKDSNATIYFDGVEESYHHEYIGSAESLFAFAKSVNEGGDSWTNQKVSLVADIDLNNVAWTPIGQTGATQFKGIFDGNGFTIKNLNVDSSAQTGKHYSSGLFGWAESHVTIKNVNIDGAKVVGNHNVAGIVGYTYSGKVINCHVTNAEIVCTHANDDACGDKCGLIAGYAGNESRITDCSGADSTVKAGRDAGQLVGAGYNVSLSGCTANNVAVTAGSDCTGANINEAIIGRVLG